MARKLDLQVDVDTPSTAYPFGRIRNDNGSGSGTPVTEEMYGDSHQFWAKLLSEAGISPNNLPDNVTNGFQLYQALVDLVANGLPNAEKGEWVDAGSPTLIPNVGTAYAQNTLINRYKIIGKTFFWQFMIAMGTSGGPNTVKVLYPTGITPRYISSASSLHFFGLYNGMSTTTSPKMTLCSVLGDGVSAKTMDNSSYLTPQYLFEFFATFELD